MHPCCEREHILGMLRFTFLENRCILEAAAGNIIYTSGAFPIVYSVLVGYIEIVMKIANEISS